MFKITLRSSLDGHFVYGAWCCAREALVAVESSQFLSSSVGLPLLHDAVEHDDAILDFEKSSSRLVMNSLGMVNRAVKKPLKYFVCRTKIHRCSSELQN